MPLFSLSPSLSISFSLSILIFLGRLHSQSERILRWPRGAALRAACARSSLPTTETYAARNRETVATERHPPQDTKIVAGPSSWLTAWLGLALVGWLEVRTVVERLVGLEIAWWWVFVEVSEAPPWYLAASNPSRWGCKQQPCPVVCASVAFRLCPALRQLTRLLPRAVDLFPTSVLSRSRLSGTPADAVRRRGGRSTRRKRREAARENYSLFSHVFRKKGGLTRCARAGEEPERGKTLVKAKEGKEARRWVPSHADDFSPSWRT